MATEVSIVKGRDKMMKRPKLQLEEQLTILRAMMGRRDRARRHRAYSSILSIRARCLSYEVQDGWNVLVHVAADACVAVQRPTSIVYRVVAGPLRCSFAIKGPTSVELSNMSPSDMIRVSWKQLCRVQPFATEPFPVAEIEVECRRHLVA